MRARPLTAAASSRSAIVHPPTPARPTPTPTEARDPSDVDVEDADQDELAEESELEEEGRRPDVLAALGLVPPPEDPPQEIPLPHRGRLERGFGVPLGALRVLTGPTIRLALDGLGARAASVGDTILLRDRGASLPTVAHEVAHALQPTTSDTNSGVEAADTPAEQEAHRASAALVAGAHVPRPVSPRAPGSLALLRLGDLEGFIGSQLQFPDPEALRDAARGAIEAATVGGKEEEEPEEEEEEEKKTLKEQLQAALAAQKSLIVGDPIQKTEEVVEEPAPEPEKAPEERRTFKQQLRDALAPTLGPRALPETTEETPTEEAAPPEGEVDEARVEAAEAEAVEDVEAPTAEEVAEEAAAPAEDTQTLPAAAADAEPERQPRTLAEGLRAMVAMPPSVAVEALAPAAARLGDLAQSEHKALVEATPDLPVVMEGRAEPVEVDTDALVAAAEPVDLPQSDTEQTPEVAEAEAPAPFVIDPGVTAELAASDADAPPGETATLAAEAAAALPTDDPGLVTSPGPAPSAALAASEGQGQLTTNAGLFTLSAEEGFTTAEAAIQYGPGEEVIQPQALEEQLEVPEVEAPEVEAPEVDVADLGDHCVEGEQIEALDAEAQPVFEEHAAPQLSAIEGADVERQEGWAAAEQTALDDAAVAQEDAEVAQTAVVEAQRERIATARADTLARQQEAVAETEQGLQTQKEAENKTVQGEVTAAQTLIDNKYSQTERQAQDKADQARADAEAKQKEAEEPGWLAQARDKIVSAIGALRTAIGDIFDRARQALHDLIDKARTFAQGQIDRVASAAKDAVGRFGTFAKGAVDTLLGSTLPGLAEDLGNLIDDGVALASDGIDAVAEGYRGAVAFVADGLHTATDVVTTAYETLVDTQLAVWEATIAGDWETLLDMGLDAVSLLGEPLMDLLRTISPELADFIDQGPVQLLMAEVAQRLDAWLCDLVGDMELAETVTAFVDSTSGALKGLYEGFFAENADACEDFTAFTTKLTDFTAVLFDNPVVNTLKALMEGANDILATVLGLLVEVNLALLQPVWDALGFLADGVGAMFGAVKDASAQLWTWVSGLLGLDSCEEDTGEGSGLWGMLSDAASTVWTVIKEDIGPAFIDGISTAAKLWWDFSIFKLLFDLVDAAGSAITALKEWFNSSETIQSAPEKLGEVVLPVLESALLFMGDTFASVVDSLAGMASGLADAVVGALAAFTGGDLAHCAQHFLDDVQLLTQSLADWVVDLLVPTKDNVRDVIIEGARSTIRTIIQVISMLGLVMVSGGAALGPMLASVAWKLLPDCYKPAIIDVVVTVLLQWLNAQPDLPLFGPLWSLLKPGVVGFLEAVLNWQPEEKIAVSNRLASILTSDAPQFMGGFVLGLLQGLWEGLTDPFMMIWMAADGLRTLVDWVATLSGNPENSIKPKQDEAAAAEPAAQAEGEVRTLHKRARAEAAREPDLDAAARAAAAVDPQNPVQSAAAASSVYAKAVEDAEPALTPANDIQMPGAASAAAPGAAQPGDDAALVGRLGEMGEELRPDVEDVGDNFMPAVEEHFSSSEGAGFGSVTEKLGDMWTSAQDAIHGAGGDLANSLKDALLGVPKPADGEAVAAESPEAAAQGLNMFEIGKTVGWIAGMIAFEVILGLLTVGSWTAASGAMKVLKGIATLINKINDLFGLVFQLFGKVGKALLKALDPIKKLLGRAKGKAGELITAIRRIGDKLLGWADELLAKFGVKKKGATPPGAGKADDVARKADDVAAREVREEVGEQGAKGARKADDVADATEKKRVAAEASVASEILEERGLPAAANAEVLFSVFKPQHAWIKDFTWTKEGTKAAIWMIASKDNINDYDKPNKDDSDLTKGGDNLDELPTNSTDSIDGAQTPNKVESPAIVDENPIPLKGDGLDHIRRGLTPEQLRGLDMLSAHADAATVERIVSKKSDDFLANFAAGPRVMNVGSGTNPLPGAINTDIRDLPDVDVVANASGGIPFSDGLFDEVLSKNPEGFNPLATDAVRVLKPGGTFTVVGQPSNYQLRQLKRMSDADLRKLGLKRLDPIDKLPHMEEKYLFGTTRLTKGDEIYLGPRASGVMVGRQLTFRKLQ
ncbi:MAG: DUF4157 domain-containing protein [Alphaproteobacteria bacterium]|nr:DUF4157 domain-containing protein [Alphaproteobacteria bacterium]